MSNQIIVGLDIGTTKIACFLGQRDENTKKVHILGYGKTPSLGVEHGVVRNILTTAESIKKAVEMAADQANVDIEEVYVGIAGQHIKSMQNQGSIMIPGDHKYITQEDVEKLIADQHQIMLAPGEQIIHVFPQSFIVDGEELSNEVSPVGVAGKQLKANFHIVTGNNNNLTNIRDAVNKAGLKIKGVVLEPIASAYAVLDDRDRSAGVALVDIGGGTTDIAIFQDGVIRHTSVLATAGKAITNDIKEGCNIMQSQAETLKTRFGSCLPQEVSENDIVSVPGIHNQPAREIALKTLAGIIKARTETILDQVSYEISQSGFDKRLIAGVVLTGGGAQLRNIKDLASYTTGLYTRIGMPNEHLVTDTPKELIEPMYATGIGLVLYGIEEAENEEGKKNRPDAMPHVEETVPEQTYSDSQGEQHPDEQVEEPDYDAEKDTKERKKERKKKKENKTNESKITGGASFGTHLKEYLDRLFSPNVEPEDNDKE
jgi:cell division protein FtsA